MTEKNLLGWIQQMDEIADLMKNANATSKIIGFGTLGSLSTTIALEERSGNLTKVEAEKAEKHRQEVIAQFKS